MSGLSGSRLPAGPRADRVSIWPMGEGRYGLDATFVGASGYKLVERHEGKLRDSGVKWSLRHEFEGGWTLRFGPLPVADIEAALRLFVTV